MGRTMRSPSESNGFYWFNGKEGVLSESEKKRLGNMESTEYKHIAASKKEVALNLFGDEELETIIHADLPSLFRANHSLDRYRPLYVRHSDSMEPEFVGYFTITDTTNYGMRGTSQSASLRIHSIKGKLFGRDGSIKEFETSVNDVEEEGIKRGVQNKSQILALILAGIVDLPFKAITEDEEQRKERLKEEKRQEEIEEIIKSKEEADQRLKELEQGLEGKAKEIANKLGIPEEEVEEMLKVS